MLCKVNSVIKFIVLFCIVASGMVCRKVFKGSQLKHVSSIVKWVQEIEWNIIDRKLFYVCSLGVYLLEATLPISSQSHCVIFAIFLKCIELSIRVALPVRCIQSRCRLKFSSQLVFRLHTVNVETNFPIDFDIDFEFLFPLKYYYTNHK